jgi:hypothetical protein
VYGLRSFLGPVLWNSAFSDANGWNSVKYYSTIRYPNIDGGSGRPDVCARGSSGVVCGFSNGVNSFTNPLVWSSAFSDANGWGSAKYYRTIEFPDLNGDGLADVCGRGSAGISCGLSNGFSSFSNVQLWTTAFSDSAGWDEEEYFATINYPDVDKDGMADVCGRGVEGMYCAFSNGSSFQQFQLYSDVPSDSNGWNQPKYYTRLQFAEIDGTGNADLCGRGSGGILCEP